MVSFSRYYTFKFIFVSICTREEPITGNTVYFTPEDEDEFIMEKVSIKLEWKYIQFIKQSLEILNTN